MATGEPTGTVHTLSSLIVGPCCGAGAAATIFLVDPTKGQERNKTFAYGVKLRKSTPPSFEFAPLLKDMIFLMRNYRALVFHSYSL